MKSKTVDILGTEYTIKYKKVRNVDFDGQCDCTSKEIIVRKDNYYGVGNFEWLQRKSLRHEIIHAFLSECGLCSNWQHDLTGHDETFVDWYAIMYPKIKKVYDKLGIG